MENLEDFRITVNGIDVIFSPEENPDNPWWIQTRCQASFDDLKNAISEALEVTERMIKTNTK